MFKEKLFFHVGVFKSAAVTDCCVLSSLSSAGIWKEYKSTAIAEELSASEGYLLLLAFSVFLFLRSAYSPLGSTQLLI